MLFNKLTECPSWNKLYCRLYMSWQKVQFGRISNSTGGKSIGVFTSRNLGIALGSEI